MAGSSRDTKTWRRSHFFASDAEGNNSGASSSVPGSTEEEKPIDLLAALSLGEQALLQNKHLQVGGKLVICFKWHSRAVLVICMLLSDMMSKGV